MPIKGSGPTSLTEIDRYEEGVGWVAYPDETMQRASHALRTDEGVWVIDPVDADGVDELLEELGEVAGVAVLLDRHKRDAAAVANRHDVPVSIPAWMTGVADSLDAPVERLGDHLGGTDFEIRRLVDWPVWQEAALFDGETLVVPEALGTVDYFTTGDERVGVHPMLRLTPPTQPGSLSVDRLLVGHGSGVFDDPEPAIEDAVANARRRAPKVWAESVRDFFMG